MSKFFRVLAKAVVFLAVCILLVIATRIPFIWDAFTGLNNDGINAVWRQFLPAILIIAVNYIADLIMEKRRITAPFSRHGINDFLIGFLFGILLLGVTMGLLYVVSDTMELGSFYSFPYSWLWFIAVLFSVIAKEYLLRGYLFSLLLKEYGNAAALIVSTALFFFVYAYGHLRELGIISVLNILALGLLLSMVRIQTRGLLAPVTVHFIWIAGGAILFGMLPGFEYDKSFMHASAIGAPIFTGGDHMLEGSLITFLVIVGLIDLAFIIIKSARDDAKRRSKRPAGKPRKTAEDETKVDGSSVPASAPTEDIPPVVVTGPSGDGPSVPVYAPTEDVPPVVVTGPKGYASSDTIWEPKAYPSSDTVWDAGEAKAVTPAAPISVNAPTAPTAPAAPAAEPVAEHIDNMPEPKSWQTPIPPVVEERKKSKR